MTTKNTIGRAKARPILPFNMIWPSEYNSWRAMVDRCTRPGHKYHHDRGIQVCSKWLTSFKAFFLDMGPKPSPQYTIERIDTDGNYEPGNCKWATYKEQRLNQRPYDESERVRKAWQNRLRKSNQRVDITGERFGRLVVLEYATTVGKTACWLCTCDCGRQVVVKGKSLRSGNVKSCGCLNIEQARSRAIARNKQPRLWITDGKTSKFVLPQTTLPKGWRYGRTL